MENFKISVPMLITMEDDDVKKYIKMLKDIRAERVFLIAPFDAMYHKTIRLMRERYGENIQKIEESIKGNTYPKEIFSFWSELLKDKIKIFNENGIETGFWMGYTIGHGGDLSGDVCEKEATQITGVDGREAKGCFCPLDQNFVKQITVALSEIAKSGVKYILFDDDFRLDDHSIVKHGCYCPLHIDLFNKRTGLNFTREDIVNKALSPQSNKYRKMWFDTLGESLYQFADAIEKAVHAVNPDTRLGIATAMSLYGSEGVKMPTLLKHLNGKTKPFLRLSGAPYWNSSGVLELGATIEYNKNQIEWLKNENIDVMCEGDTFPHNRYLCSANNLLSYNAGVLAAGAKEVFDYVFAYSTRASYETGYVENITDNREYLNHISDMFSRGENVGFNIIHRIADIDKIPFPDDPKEISNYFDKPYALDFLSRMGVPIGDNGDYPYFLYGGNIQNLIESDFEKIRKNGAVMDIDAALALKKLNIDVGINQAEIAPAPTFEIFNEHEINGDYRGERVFLLGVGESDRTKIFYKCDIVSDSRIISNFANRSHLLYPAAYLYTNQNQAKFMVYTFSLKKALCQGQLLYGYARQMQLANSMEYLTGKILDVVVCKQPNIHVMCKRINDGFIVGIQNLSMDTIDSPVLRMAPCGNICSVEIAKPGSQNVEISKGNYNEDGKYGYLTVDCIMHPLDFIGLRIVIGK